MTALIILVAANLGITTYIWYRTLYAPLTPPVATVVTVRNINVETDDAAKLVYGLRDAFAYENRKGDKGNP